MFRIEELLEATGGVLRQGRNDLLVKGLSIDSRTIKPKEAFVAFKGERFDGHDFIEDVITRGARCILYERKNVKKVEKFHTSGICFIEVVSGLKALGDIAFFWRNKFAIPVIAITGSNGKTTTKELIAHVLSARFNVLKTEGTKNNQVGLPMTLLRMNSAHEMAVVELGTNHFGEIGYLARIAQPNIAAITNIGPSHLAYLKNIAGVAKEKLSLLKYLQNPGVAILNSDDASLHKLLTKKTRHPFAVGVGIKRPADFRAQDIHYLSGEIKFTLKNKHSIHLKAIGRHNIYNALMAITIARSFGMSYNTISKQLAHFDFPAGRLKLIKAGQMRIIDDTYNANPLSLLHALETLNDFRIPGRKIFVMGDMRELGKGAKKFHRHAGKEAVKACDVFIAVGKFAAMAAEEARRVSCGRPCTIFTCSSTTQARTILTEKIAPDKDDIVLIKGSRGMKMEDIFKAV